MKKRDKGLGTLRKRKDGLWEGRYIDSNGKSRSIYGRRKADVSEKLLAVSYVKSANVFDRVGGDVPLDIWFEHYINIKKYQVKERSLYQIKLAYKSHISPVIGHKILFSISSNDIIRILNSLEQKNLADSSKKNIITHMRTMFNFAQAEGSINLNPMLVLKLDKSRPKSKRRELTDEEIHIFLKYSESYDEQVYLMICTLLYTGIRVGELCGLRWNDLPKDFSSININESITDNRFETDTKSQNSERIIPLNDFLRNKYKEKYLSVKNSKNFSESDYVFLNRFNRRYTSGTVNKRMQYLRAIIKENENIDVSHITPHYFRHTFATRGLYSGIPIPDLKELTGHIKTDTLLGYIHSNDQRKINSINAITQSMPNPIVN